MDSNEYYYKLHNLLLRLKEAGFPQDLAGRRSSTGKPAKFWGSKGKPYYPTLSELIKECGKDFRTLQRVENDTSWVALTFDSPDGDSVYESGETPLIAVAKLYLLLKGMPFGIKVREEE